MSKFKSKIYKFDIKIYESNLKHRNSNRISGKLNQKPKGSNTE